MKQLKDYLHLYLGCDFQYFLSGGRMYVDTIKSVGTTVNLSFVPEDIKLILRPLSDMTEEEAADIYTIERDKVLHPPTNDHDISRRMDTGWAVTRLDHMNIGLLIRFDGVCYKVVDEGKKPTIEPAMNQPLIFHYLLSKHFDLFNLIKENLAIDKTTLP